jgi:hypothetical protein
MVWRSMVCEGEQPVPADRHCLRERRSTECKGLHAAMSRVGMYVIGDGCGVQTRETTRTDGGGHYGRFLFEFHQK